VTDPRDVIRRAHEAVQRVDAANRERALERQLRGPADDLDRVEPRPVADWWTCKSTKEMTTRQFHAWLDVGKPPLEPPKPAPSKPERQNGMTETQVRAHVTARLDGLVAVLGEEVAAVEKKIRSDLNVELAELRAQVYELRHSERSTEVIDLPDDWRSRATH
jgi:hypothetical protein